MEFRLTEEQRMIKDTARDLVAREIEPVLAAHDRDRPLPQAAMLKLYAALEPLGLMAPRLPEEVGGSALPYLSYGLIMEQLPAALGISILSHESTTTRIYLGADEEQKRRFLPALVKGKTIACSGISEPNVGSDPRAIETRARREGDQVVIDGTKLWITNGTVADLMVAVAAMAGAGLDRAEAKKSTITRIVVERAHSPYQAHEVAAIGMRQGHLSEIVFEGCRVPARNVLGEPGDAHQALTLTWLANRPLVGLMAVGLAQRALDACLAYVGMRKQFGRHIGSFQLVQQMLSEMLARIEASRLLCLRALALMDEGARSNKEAATAKWFATENCLHALHLAMQVHGASGLTDEVGLERLFRDARMLTIPDGTTQIQHLIVGQELTGFRSFRS
ncbi:MAG: acyl-CoA/acyl-ACP dehydrogenase [Candidatus Lambdaproteobacteria bacterium]|nr:acyl-CoA/acyl-ACP dehydrogenase [Candidatus Lambdaproteobacteria bacterium]